VSRIKTCHSTQVKERALASFYKTKEYVLANGASRYEAWSLHVYMRFCKALYCAAMRALCFRNRNVHREYFAQFTRGSIAVKVMVVVVM